MAILAQIGFWVSTVCMSFLAKYRAYVNDNPQGYWFRRKIWGWGWTPVMWQGWAVLGAFIVVLVGILVPFINNLEPTNAEVGWFLAKVFGWVLLLISVCYLTGEPPKWQWGFPEKK